mgnify:CR=1 FL=1
MFKKHYILWILLSITCFVQLLMFDKNNKLKKVEDELTDQSYKIENCIDIENKNKRTIYENIKLSEYCIDNFGTNK